MSQCRRTSILISSFILLRDTLAALPALAGALQGGQAALLATMRGTFGHRAFADMLAAVNEVIDEVGTAVRGFRFRSAASTLQSSAGLSFLCPVIHTAGHVHVKRQSMIHDKQGTLHALQDVQASKAAFVNKTQQCFAVRGKVTFFENQLNDLSLLSGI